MIARNVHRACNFMATARSMRDSMGKLGILLPSFGNFANFLYLFRKISF